MLSYLLGRVSQSVKPYNKGGSDTLPEIELKRAIHQDYEITGERLTKYDKMSNLILKLDLSKYEVYGISIDMDLTLYRKQDRIKLVIRYDVKARRFMINTSKVISKSNSFDQLEVLNYFNKLNFGGSHD